MKLQRVFLPVLSDLLAAEVNDAPESVRALYAELVQLNPAILTITPEVINLASHYQQRGILTLKYYDDGLHIALATVFESDVLVSWNFKHIVHFDKIRYIFEVTVYDVSPAKNMGLNTTYSSEDWGIEFN